MKVSRLPVDPGPAAWNCLLEPRASLPPLESNINADYLVIGAGFAGLAAARRLHQIHDNAKIVVLEASGVAMGPAGRNSGFMIDLPHDLSSSDYAGAKEEDHRQTGLNRAAIQFAADAVEEFSISPEAFQSVGKTNAAATDKGMAHNRDYAKHLATLGEEYKILDAAQMQEMTGIDYYQGGLWTPGTAILQPALFIRGCADGLQRSPSIAIHEYSPVTQLERKASQWLASTPAGSVSAPKVLLAVNGMLQSFGYYQNRLLDVFTYGSMTRALSQGEIKTLGGHDSWACTPADPMGTTVRRISGSGGHRLIVRNRFTCDPKQTVSEKRLVRVARDHQQSYQARFGKLADVEMEYVWGGRLCLSLNNVSVISEVEEGLFSACCQNGIGVAKGTVSGIVAAEQAAGGGKSLMAGYRVEDAPVKLLPKPFLSVGANVVMRYKEWRAGAEF